MFNLNDEICGRLVLLLVTQNQQLIEKLARRMAMYILAAPDIESARAVIAEMRPSCVVIDFSVGQREALAFADELHETQRQVMTIGLLDRGDKLLPAA